MDGDALSQALALHKMPDLRFGLREAALARELLEAIQLAAASQPLLAQTAERLSLSETALLEIVRFYLQQVLFEGDPDAYRTLGATREADVETLREHFRWLQRWLHPDRRGEDWEALFTTRVNWAWSQVRNEERRATYDLSLDESSNQDVGASAEGADAALSGSGRWQMVPVAAPKTPRRGMRVASVSVGMLLCGVLLVLALEREQAARRGVVATPATAIVEPKAVSTPVSHATDSPTVAPSTIPALLPAVRDATPVQSSQSSVAEPAISEGQSVLVSTKLARGETRLGQRPDGAEQDSVPVVAVARVDPVGAAPVRSATGASARSTQAGVQFDRVDVARSKRSATQHRSRSSAVVTGSVESKSPVIETEMAAVGSDSVIGEPVAVVNTQREPASEVTSPATNDVKESPAHATSAVSALAHAEAVQVASVSTTSRPRRATSSGDLVDRVESARRSVRALARYFGEGEDLDLHWPDEATAERAREQRDALWTRNATTKARQFTLDAPYWRFAEGSANAQTSYRLGAGRTTVEQGLMRVDLQWGHTGWQVVDVQLSPSP